jgi:hypothetical protein
MRRFRPLGIPNKAHPLVRRMFAEMNHQRIGVLDMSDRSGINKNTLQDWRTRTVPTVDNLEACFTVLGCELTIRQSRED